MLKKQFKEKDVRRIRNLITKDYDERTEHTVGYDVSHKDRNEGDVWEENGKKWTIENGILKSITKLGNLRKSSRLPLKCPNCNRNMNKRNDKKMYSIHKMCFDCVIDFEHELKVLGKYEEYERSMMRNNVEAFIQTLSNMIIEVENHNPEYVTEQGDVEEWSNTMDKVKRDAVNHLKSFINKLEPIYNKDSIVKNEEI